MKKVTMLMFLICSVAFAAPTKDLVGTWKGSFKENVYKKSNGGSPTEGATNTEAVIEFDKNFVGKSYTGGDMKTAEKWEIKGKTYTWGTNDYTVSTMEQTKDQIMKDPKRSWIFKQYPAFKNSKNVVFYKYESCKGKCDLPTSIKDSGTWVFDVTTGKKLTHAVLYEYSSKENDKRKLVWELTKQK